MFKKYCLFVLVLSLILIINITPAFSQRVVRLGDLPKSDFTISIYQVVGFQEGAEGYKITYLDTNNELKHLYLPAAMRDKYLIYRPRENTFNQNFVIIWRKGDTVARVEWFMPQKIDYTLPFFTVSPFGEEDKKIFERITKKGELVLEAEALGGAPVIRAPGE